MDAPKCRFCGKRHWGVCVANAVAEAEKVANKPVVVANVVANKHGKYADKEKRRAYMKEYMRKRRAGDVEKKS